METMECQIHSNEIEQDSSTQSREQWELRRETRVRSKTDVSSVMMLRIQLPAWQAVKSESVLNMSLVKRQFDGNSKESKRELTLLASKTMPVAFN